MIATKKTPFWLADAWSIKVRYKFLSIGDYSFLLNIINFVIFRQTNKGIAKLSCKYHIQWRRKKRERERENAPTCIAQQTQQSGCPGIWAMWPLFCPQALSALSAPVCRPGRWASGRVEERMTPKGLSSIPTICTQRGLGVRFSRDTVQYLKAAWKIYFANGDCNIAEGVFWGLHALVRLVSALISSSVPNKTKTLQHLGFETPSSCCYNETTRIHCVKQHQSF